MMRKFGSALAYYAPQCFQVNGHRAVRRHYLTAEYRLGGQIVSPHSPWFQPEPLGPPGVCVSLLIVSSIV